MGWPPDYFMVMFWRTTDTKRLIMRIEYQYGGANELTISVRLQVVHLFLQPLWIGDIITIHARKIAASRGFHPQIQALNNVAPGFIACQADAAVTKPPHDFNGGIG